jgi:hypothetical protein
MIDSMVVPTCRTRAVNNEIRMNQTTRTLKDKPPLMNLNIGLDRIGADLFIFPICLMEVLYPSFVLLALVTFVIEMGSIPFMS